MTRVVLGSAAVRNLAHRQLRCHKRTGSTSVGAIVAELRVHVARPIPAMVDHRFRSKLKSGILLTAGDTDIPPDTQVLIRGLKDISEEDLAALPALDAFVFPAAGPSMDQQHSVLAECLRRAQNGIPDLLFCNSHHNAPMTAELGVALILSAAKRIVPADAAIRRGDWRCNGQPLPGGPPGFPPETLPMLVLDGKRALVVGLGQIGSRIAMALTGLGMDVHAIRRSAEGQAQHREPILDGATYITVHPPNALNSLLPQTTVLVLAVPGTDSTQGLIGSEELRSLAEDAVVVNVARGNVLDEAAVYEAVHSGRLFGFASDVWYKYPKTHEESLRCMPWSDPAHDFSQCDNVVLSPHRGGARGVPETEWRRWDGLADALNNALDLGVSEGLPTGVIGEFGLQRGY